MCGPRAIRRGAVDLYQDDQRVARRRNGGVSCGTPAVSASVAGIGSAGSTAWAGSWSAPFPWPVVALHLSLLPDGRVLSWGHVGTPQVWDPATGGFTSVASPSLLFCAGHSFLPDGRLLGSGGHITDDHGLPDENLFTAASQSWSVLAPMRRGRWYPTNTTLGSGEVVLLAGRDQSGVAVAEPEVWSSGTVKVLSGREPRAAALPARLPGPQRARVLRGRAPDHPVPQPDWRGLVDHGGQPALRTSTATAGSC